MHPGPEGVPGQPADGAGGAGQVGGDDGRHGKEGENHFPRVVHTSTFFNIFFLDPPRLHREHGRRRGEQLRPDVLRVGGGGQEDGAEGEAAGMKIG